MATRQITGLVIRGDGTPWPGVTAAFRMERFSYNAEGTSPVDEVEVVTATDGTFTAALEAGLATRWIASIPGTPEFSFVLDVGDGSPITISELRALTGVSVPLTNEAETAINAALVPVQQSVTDLEGVVDTKADATETTDALALKAPQTAVDDIEAPGWVDRDRLAADVSSILGNIVPSLVDDFSTYTDGAMDGLDPILGNPWGVTGSFPTIIDTGRATSSGDGNGYIVQTFADDPVYMTCDVSWSGGVEQQMTMSWCRDPLAGDLLDHLVHFNFGPIAFHVTIRQDAGNFESSIQRTWFEPMLRDGTVYSLGFAVSGNTLTVYGHDGSIHSVYDARIGAALAGGGKTVFWEPGGSPDTRAYLHAAQAFESSDAPLRALSLGPEHIASLGRHIGARDQIVGSPSASGQVTMGDGGDGMPRITFGASLIRATLLADSIIGATSFQVSSRFPANSTIVIGSGDDAETLTQNGAIATGSVPPHTVTTTAGATKTHTAGDPVTVTPTAAMVSYMFMNPQNGSLSLPTFVVIPNGLYFGVGSDVRLYWTAVNQLSLATGDSLQIMGGGWNTGTLQLGTRHLWVDATGALRIKSGAPTSDLDGVTVGSQA